MKNAKWNKINQFILLTCFILAGPADHVLAAAKTDSDTVNQIIYLNEGITVTAERTTTQIFDRPESISILNSAQMEFYMPATSPDALSLIPGVFVQKTNLGGGSPFIRGLTGYHTLILVDGIRLNNSIFRSGPNQYLNTIDPFMINRIEVMKGSGSSQYGSDAIGGTIHLLSDAPEIYEDGFAIGIKGFGRYWHPDMEKSGRAELYGGNTIFGFKGGISYKNFGDIIAGEDFGRQVPNGYDETNFDLKGKIRISERSSITGTYYFTRQSEVPLYHKLVNDEYDIYQFDPQQTDLKYLRWNQDLSGNLLKSLEITVSHQQMIEERQKEKSGTGLYEVEKDKVNTAGLTGLLKTQITPYWDASSGLDLYYDKIESKKTVIDKESGTSANERGLYPDGSEYSGFGFFSLHSMVAGGFLFNGGIRYNMYKIQLRDSTFGALSLNPEALTGHFGIIYKLTSNKRITFMTNTGYRAPNINDVSSFGIADFRYEIPSYDLKPERSFNNELGYKQRGKNISFSLSLYYNQLFNLIINQPSSYLGLDSLDGYRIYQKQNTGQAVITGSEASLEMLIFRKLLAYTNISYTYGQNIIDEEPLRRIPPLNGRFGLKYYPVKNLELAGELIIAGSQKRLSGGDSSDDRIPEGGTPGWQVVNLILQYSIPRVILSGSVQNVFHQLYKTHGSGIYGPGRSVWLAVTLNINTKNVD